MPGENAVTHALVQNQPGGMGHLLKGIRKIQPGRAER
jgi:hypothetical protein